MLYYLLDIIPKIQVFSKKLDDTTLLINQHWVSINEIESSKTVFIFRPNDQLIVSENGKIERGSWEYIGSNSLMLERQSESFLFKHGFLDESVLALKLDGTDTYALFINESKYGKEINSKRDVVSFLESKYLTQRSPYESKNMNGVIGRPLEKVKLIDGRELIFYSTQANQTTVIEGCSVSIGNSKPENGLYKSVTNKRFEIINGFLSKEYNIKRYEQLNGDIIEIDEHRMQTSQKGNRVWSDNQPAANGQYKIGFFTKITVLNGLII